MKKQRCFSDLAKLDCLRDKRCGIPEFILSTDKSYELVYDLLIKLAKLKGFSAATRVTKEHIEFIEDNKESSFSFDY